MRSRGEGGVGEIGVDAHEHPLLGLEVAGGEHHPRHPQRVDLRPRGEGVGEALELVALVVVFNGVAEVDGVGGVGLQRVGELHGDAAPVGGDLGGLLAHGRDHHLGIGVLDVDDLVEIQCDAARRHAGGALRRVGAHEARRLLIARAPRGIAHRGTARRHKRRKQRRGQSPHRPDMSVYIAHLSQLIVKSRKNIAKHTPFYGEISAKSLFYAVK